MKTKRQMRALLATVFQDPMVVWCRTLGTQIKRRDQAVCTCSHYRYGSVTRVTGEWPNHHKVHPYYWWAAHVAKFGGPK